jgi:hypothetical protein
VPIEPDEPVRFQYDLFELQQIQDRSLGAIPTNPWREFINQFGRVKGTVGFSRDVLKNGITRVKDSLDFAASADLDSHGNLPGLKRTYVLLLHDGTRISSVPVGSILGKSW